MCTIRSIWVYDIGEVIDFINVAGSWAANLCNINRLKEDTFKVIYDIRLVPIYVDAHDLTNIINIYISFVTYKLVCKHIFDSETHWNLKKFKISITFSIIDV